MKMNEIFVKSAQFSKNSEKMVNHVNQMGKLAQTLKTPSV